MTKHLLRNSSGLQAVLCIKKSVICSIRYAYTNLIILRANFGCKTLQRLVVEQPIQSDYFLWSSSLMYKERYLHPPCSTRWSQDYTFLHDFCSYNYMLMAQFIPPKPTQFVFSCTLSESLPWLAFYLRKKRKEKVKVTLIECFNDCLFTETSDYSSSSSWLAAGNSCEEEPSSVPETHCQPDETTMEQHIFDDVVTLCSKNGKKSRKQWISECFTWYNK